MIIFYFSTKSLKTTVTKGERFVPDYELVALARFFNLTTDELLGLKEADN